MATRLSPGGSLLRTSRMFSIPSPLVSNTLASGLQNHSPSATTATPTHLSIASTENALSRGDWGLKRSLPEKSLTGSSPVIRVKEVDAFEKVTDFTSAADHTVSLQKFQEMNISMTLPRVPFQTVRNSFISVFEKDWDTTALPKERLSELRDKRWKFKEPALSSMSDADFRKFLSKQVRGRRQEFRDFLRHRIAQNISSDRKNRAMDSGNSGEVESVKMSEITEKQLQDYIRSMCDLNERLSAFQLISQFLDLPPNKRLEPSRTAQYTNSTIDGPPACHPSAGISYLRTSSHIDNHSLYGPQKHMETVQARVLSPSRGPVSTKFGVGGFVAKSVSSYTYHNRRPFKSVDDATLGLHQFDPNVEGGTKIYASPDSASVNSEGHVVLEFTEPSSEALMVYREKTGRSVVYLDPTFTERKWTMSELARRDTEAPMKPLKPATKAQTYSFGDKSQSLLL